MRGMGLIDLPNRPGKRPGAFCVQIPDEGTAAILCNSTGQAMDVRTLIHEMGHAFQALESQATLPLSAYYLPTLDAAEIHSMGMEYLALRHIGAFFNENDAARFRKRRWRDAVEIVTYACVVDEFQHWVYEHPWSSPDERDQAWDAIHDAFRGEIDFSDCERYKAARWYAQHHIFQTPFYYIDYAIAEIGAMQLALVDARDAAEALRVYLNLCRVGGSMSVLSIFSKAGMRSPFDENLLKDLARHASDSLGLD
jgi:M3 family oligoendopeptidase